MDSPALTSRVSQALLTTLKLRVVTTTIVIMILRNRKCLESLRRRRGDSQRIAIFVACQIFYF